MAKRDAKCSFCRKSPRDVGPLVAGPNVYICAECLELCQSIIEQEKRRRSARPTLPIPADIAEKLQQYGVSPPATNETIAAVVHRHYASGAGKRVILLTGPASSRIYFARVLARIVGAPFSAPPTQPHDLVLAVLQAADFDTESAEKAIVYFDHGDLRVQDALVELLSQEVYQLGSESKSALKFKTRELLFVAGMEGTCTEPVGEAIAGLP